MAKRFKQDWNKRSLALILVTHLTIVYYTLSIHLIIHIRKIYQVVSKYISFSKHWRYEPKSLNIFSNIMRTNIIYAYVINTRKFKPYNEHTTFYIYMYTYMHIEGQNNAYKYEKWKLYVNNVWWSTITTRSISSSN